MSCSGFLMPFDLQCILVNTLAGDWTLFVFIMIITIACLAAYFRMNNLISMVMMALFVIFLAPYMGGIYVLTILIAGIVIFYSMSKLLTR